MSKRINHQIGTSVTGLLAVKDESGHWVSKESGRPVSIDHYGKPSVTKATKKKTTKK
jgi:hypothetical protein